MDVNGITNNINSYSTYETTTKVTKEAAAEVATTENGVVYEPSGKTDSKNQTVKVDAEFIAKLQADAEERLNQLKSLVEKLITGQGNAIASADDIWSFLRSGDFTVDAETKAQAQADIAEDGYWGVEQTSDRILDFAKALAGDNPEMIEKMREAFKEGFELATKTWGDTLPDISQRTYEATMKKFDAWAAEVSGTKA